MTELGVWLHFPETFEATEFGFDLEFLIAPDRMRMGSVIWQPSSDQNFEALPLVMPMVPVQRGADLYPFLLG